MKGLRRLVYVYLFEQTRSPESMQHLKYVRTKIASSFVTFVVLRMLVPCMQYLSMIKSASRCCLFVVIMRQLYHVFMLVSAEVQICS